MKGRVLASKDRGPNSSNEDIWEDLDSEFPGPFNPTKPFMLEAVAVSALFGNPIWTQLMELTYKGNSHNPCYLYTYTHTHSQGRVQYDGWWWWLIT